MVTSVLGLESAYADDVPVQALTATVPTTATVHEPTAMVEGADEAERPGPSISCGRANRGALFAGEALPRAGFGYQIPEPWWQRGYSYGASHLLDLIRRAAAEVANEHPGAVVGIADISKIGGGALPGHRSHQSGRDIDLIYYALDAVGQPLMPDAHMGYYGASGRSTYARSPAFVRNIPERYFDLARNWALVLALVNDTEAEVQHIFVSDRVRRWLLRYGRRIGEPVEVLDRVSRVLRHPRGASSHNDHMHVRVRCSDRDSVLGRCRDGSAAPPRRGRRWYTRVRCPKPVVVESDTMPAALPLRSSNESL